MSTRPETGIDRLIVTSNIFGETSNIASVLRGKEAWGACRVISLGGLIGIGRQPRECIAMARRSFSDILKGKFEFCLTRGSECAMSYSDRASLELTKLLLDDVTTGSDDISMTDYIEQLPIHLVENDYSFTYGSPLDPIHDILVPSDHRNHEKMREVFDNVGRICFCGGSHAAGVFAMEQHGKDFSFTELSSRSPSFNMAPSMKYICSVGSVGARLDGSPRGFVMVDKRESILRFFCIDDDHVQHQMAYVSL